MAKALVLWDVDGTLISNGGVSKDAYGGAFELLTGLAAQHRARTGGSTDPLIMRDLASLHGVALTDKQAARIPAVLEQALTARRGDLASRGRPLPGARQALDALAEIGDVVQSVLTGNIRPNGFTKLDVFGLAGPPLDWDVGGYGSDDPVRARLVGTAQRRAGRRYGAEYTERNTVLIGDTPNDVRAGIEGGARVIGVATGKDDMSALAGADVVLPDLSDTQAVVAAVRQVLSPG